MPAQRRLPADTAIGRRSGENGPQKDADAAARYRGLTETDFVRGRRAIDIDLGVISKVVEGLWWD